MPHESVYGCELLCKNYFIMLIMCVQSTYMLYCTARCSPCTHYAVLINKSTFRINKHIVHNMLRGNLESQSIPLHVLEIQDTVQCSSTMICHVIFYSLPPFSSPKPSYILPVLLDSFIIAVVSYAISISLSKVFANKHGYTVVPNQVTVLL